MPQIFWLAPLAAFAALICARFFFTSMSRSPDGNETMVEIGDHVRQGAMAYLKQQYRILLIVFAVCTAVFALLAYVWRLQNPWLPGTFICGGMFSALAGYFGMRTATMAAPKTAAAARESLPGRAQGRLPERRGHGSGRRRVRFTERRGLVVRDRSIHARTRRRRHQLDRRDHWGAYIWHGCLAAGIVCAGRVAGSSPRLPMLVPILLAKLRQASLKTTRATPR